MNRISSIAFNNYKYCIIFTWFLFYSYFLIGVVCADPVISSIDFDFELNHGDVITIHGKGFGSGEKAIPYLWDTVDNQQAFDGIGDGESFGGLGVYGSMNNLKMDRQEANQRHTYSQAQYKSAGGNAWVGNAISAGGSSPPTSVRELFLSYWIKFDRQVFENVNNSSHKFFRSWVGGGQDLRISWTQKHFTVSNANAGGGSAQVAYPRTNSNWSSRHKADTWHHHEVWISADAGIIHTYIDGFLVINWDNQDDRYLYREHPEGIRFSLIGWNPSHGTDYVRSAKFEMSDIAILPSRARVLLSNSPKWPDPIGEVFRSDHEYQPVISWKDDKIEFEVNMGALGQETIYAYIVNSNGQVNETGFLVENTMDEAINSPRNLRIK